MKWIPQILNKHTNQYIKVYTNSIYLWEIFIL